MQLLRFQARSVYSHWSGTKWITLPNQFLTNIHRFTVDLVWRTRNFWNTECQDKFCIQQLTVCCTHQGYRWMIKHIFWHHYYLLYLILGTTFQISFVLVSFPRSGDLWKVYFIYLKGKDIDFSLGVSRYKTITIFQIEML